MWGWGFAAAVKKKRAKELLTEVYGKTLDEAAALIKDAGLSLHVLSIDGTQCTTDGQFNPDRIGIVIGGGLVKGAQIG